jgi:hypothetical protein
MATARISRIATSLFIVHNGSHSGIRLIKNTTPSFEGNRIALFRFELSRISFEFPRIMLKAYLDFIFFK